MIRVLLAEDQAMVRGALAALLNLEEDLTVVAEVARGDEVLTAAQAANPDVALLDIEMPGGDGLEAAGALRDHLPTCRVLIMTTFGRAGLSWPFTPSSLISGSLYATVPGFCCGWSKRPGQVVVG